MSNQIENDQLVLNIDRMVREFPHTPSNPSICRVTHVIRSTNSKAFDPMIISIGPFHRGKSHLKDMEKLKMRYLKQIVGESSIDEYVHAIRAEERAFRDCYAEEIELESDEFVQMLLLDGIFIIEFLRKECFDSHVSGFGNVVTPILRDLMLLENQIPLLVINLLFHLLKNHRHHNQHKFSDLIEPFFSIITSHQLNVPGDVKGDHLLGLLHSARTLSFSNTLSSDQDNAKMENIHSATELKEAGIVFKKTSIHDTTSWLDIKFMNMTIYFPELEISDVTESMLKNTIAYEHYRPSSEPRYVTDYAYFLNYLLHGSKDVEVLRQDGIISSWLGGDDRVYELIEGLWTNAESSEKFSYLGVFHSVNQHCRHRRNRWIAMLRRNHFDNPWASISLVAAVVLLSVAIVQTVYTVLGYYQDPSAAPSNPN